MTTSYFLRILAHGHLCLFGLVLLLINLPTSVSAQNLTWSDPENRWYYDFSERFNPNYETSHLSIGRDTFIDGKKCFILVGDERIRNMPVYREIIIRPTPDVLFQFADGEFHVLYDFTAEAGDTIDVYVPEVEWLRSFYVSVVVDSAYTEDVNGIFLRKQYLRTVGSGNSSYLFDGIVYEFMGNTSQYFIPMSIFACDDSCPGGQTCFSAPASNYSAALGRFASCEDVIMTGTREPGRDYSDQLTVSPNPVARDGRLRIVLPTEPGLSRRSNLALIDQHGRPVRRGVVTGSATTTTLSTTGLPAGMYYLRWTAPGAFALRKVLVSGAGR